MSHFSNFTFGGKPNNKRKAVLNDFSHKTKMFCIEQGIGISGSSHAEATPQTPISSFTSSATINAVPATVDPAPAHAMDIDDETVTTPIDVESDDESYHGSSENNDFFVDEESQADWEQLEHEAPFLSNDDEDEEDDENQDTSNGISQSLEAIPTNDAVFTDKGTTI
jgi:hypothetical protein